MSSGFGFCEPEDIPTPTAEIQMYDINNETLMGIHDNNVIHFKKFRKFSKKHSIDVVTTPMVVNDPRTRRPWMYLDIHLHDNGKDSINYVIKFDPRLVSHMKEFMLITKEDHEIVFSFTIPPITFNSMQKIAEQTIAVTSLLMTMFGDKDHIQDVKIVRIHNAHEMPYLQTLFQKVRDHNY